MLCDLITLSITDPKMQTNKYNRKKFELDLNLKKKKPLRPE